MTIVIDSPRTLETLRALAAETGEREAETISIALEERLIRLQGRKGHELLERLAPILLRVAAMPELDPRPADEIIGYNEDGHFE